MQARRALGCPLPQPFALGQAVVGLFLRRGLLPLSSIAWKLTEGGR